MNRFTYLALFVSSFALAQPPEVKTIFQKKCYACHSVANQMNGLRLDDGDAALKGGYSGVAIVKGKSAESKLVDRIASTKDGFKMPPAGARLSDSEIATIKSWIDAGASWPTTGKPSSAAAAPTFWSFQRIAKAALPPVKNESWVRSPLDRFVLARLEKESITPSAEASKTTLLRRLSLDLTGLPPTPSELEAFLRDTRADAYERQVERLLQSPHYGERWARHWLDLAHYADSDGYEKDLPRPWAWRYRNWVINAFNNDMPFDQFTVEQIAGDLLPKPTTEQMVATGFLRQTLTNREAGVDRDEARFEQLVNRVNTVSTVYLGLTMGCSQCHNHKYDPITQKDYYSLFAFFEQAEEQEIDAPVAGELGPYLAALPEYEKKRAKLLEEYEVPTLMPVWEGHMRVAITDPGKVPEWDFALTSMKAMFDHAVRTLMTPAEKRTPRDQKRLTDYFVHRNFTAVGMDKAKIDRLKELRKKLDELDKTLPPFTQAYVLVNDPKPKQTTIHIRGNWNQNGIPVEPNTPQFLPALKVDGKPNRLHLARWLVSPENPLTARVFVNRMWHEFFGRGLVKTNEDFGKTGEQPTNPELLDYLATQFMTNGWSIKALHKSIVMSAAYRQSSKARPEIDAKDPENTLLARQSRLRLPAELVRDSALYVSGLLNTDIGGKSVRPPQPAGVAELGYGGIKWNTDSGKDRYRRGLYVHFQRTTPYPMLMSFDAPDSNVACTRRARSNTALQALNLLNDEVFFEAAKAMAWRLEKESQGDLSDRMNYAFRLALSRDPSDRERQRLAQFQDKQAQIFEQEKSDFGAWLGVSRVLLNLDEFITRE
ncbi:MAG: PSD1 domain-containing protein [Bryobacterales bacterium]|nr:PSD1 domain-containing protein [Bryobacterales bacterium]